MVKKLNLETLQLRRQKRDLAFVVAFVVSGCNQVREITHDTNDSDNAATIVNKDLIIHTLDT